jgi:hypothetical protein
LRGAARQAFALVALGLLAACAASPQRVTGSGLGEALLREEAVRRRIAAALASPAEPVLSERLLEPDALARSYAGRSHRPAWLDRDGSASAAARSLLAGVAGAARHGLDPTHYHAGVLARAIAAAPRGVEHLAGRDLLLTDAFLHLAGNLATGAVDPRLLHPRHPRVGEAPDAATALAAALAAGGVEIGEVLDSMAPPHAEYAALVRALARLRAAAGAGDAGAGEGADRVRANLERWRWLPRDLGRRHLRVNTPAFTLEAFDAGAVALSMRVVVGESGWKTPLAHGLISHLVLHPAWRAPRSIATREMLPAVRRDPGYFAAHGIEVLEDVGGELRAVDPAAIDWQAVTPERFPLRLRQPPGPRNPLGRIKFEFANPYSVYLHGTPAAAAFERPLRALSHGCVRCPKCVRGGLRLRRRREALAELLRLDAQAVRQERDRVVHADRVDQLDALLLVEVEAQLLPRRVGDGRGVVELVAQAYQRRLARRPDRVVGAGLRGRTDPLGAHAERPRERGHVHAPLVLGAAARGGPVDQELAVADCDRPAVEHARAHEAREDPAAPGERAEQPQRLHPRRHHQVEELAGVVVVGGIQGGDAGASHGGTSGRGVVLRFQ